MLLRLSIINAVGGEGSNDTGKATLSNIAITKLGSTNSDGTSLTVTYSDGSTMSANKANNEILNNDEVVYEASYNITTPGTITLSFTMPANNVINEASVSEAAGCGPGSKLEQVTVDGKQSYTNNKAICVINPDSNSASTTVWTIRTNPWGGNNEQIQPTLAISGQTQSQQPTPIKTAVKGDYGMEVLSNSVEASNGNNGVIPINLSVSLYGRNSNNGSLGIIPVKDGEWSVDINLSELPGRITVSRLGGNVMAGGGMYLGSSGSYASSVVYSGSATASIDNELDKLIFSMENSVTATKHCPTQITSGTGIKWQNRCYYSGAVVYLNVPAADVPSTITQYSMYIDPISLDIAGGGSSNVNLSSGVVNWNLTSRGYGHAFIYMSDDVPGVAAWWNNNNPVYVGENINMMNRFSSSTSLASYITNFYVCNTWNPDAILLSSGFSGNGSLFSDYSVQYGIIGTDMSILPNSSQQYCGKYGDPNIENQQMFFNTLDEANQYAREHNLKVNAMRLLAPKAATGVYQVTFGSFQATFMDSNNELSDVLPEVSLNTSSISDQWNVSNAQGTTSSDTPSQWYARLVPGLLSHTLTTKPTSTSPNTTDHITITTKTYNKDTNSKITTTLPTNTYPTNNSFTITDPNGTKHTLVEGDGQDYTMAGTCSPTTSATQPSSTTPCTITFNLDHIATTYHTPITGYDPILPGQSGTTDGSNTTINPTIEQGGDGLPIAADNNGNGITHSTTPIEFDILVDSNVPTPSTLSITSQVSGTGTNYASSTFRSATASLAVATRKEFSYSLSSNASSIYASDPLSYTLSNTNTLDSTVNNLTTINVLPYDGDSNGTTGLTSYTVTNLSLDPSTATNAQLLYTTSPIARQLERTDPAALAGQSTNSANNTLASSIEWTKCNLDSNGSCTNLPTTNPDTTTTTTTSNITAIKYLASTLPSGSHPTARYTLSNLVFNNGEEGNIDSNSNNTQLVNAITYTMADILPGPVTQVSPVTTTYLGSLLSMSLDKATLSTNLASNSVAIGNGDLANPDSLTNVLNLTAKTNHGYTITLAVPDTNSNLTNTVNNQTYTIPTINTKPTKGTPGWAVAIPPTTTTTTPTNLTWHSLPNTTSPTPLAIYQTSTGGTTNLKLPITYGIATAQNTIAGPYTARVVYTVAAGL